MMDPPSRQCKYGCGRTIVYDNTLPSPPYREVDTGIHHTYKRCADLLGPNAKASFANDAAERMLKRGGRHKNV